MVQSIDDARRRQPRGGGVGRVPPHNLEAEESLLGAMLLSNDAIAAAVNIHLGAGDFYKPAHGHVYDAICAADTTRRTLPWPIFWPIARPLASTFDLDFSR